jgi:ribosomal protein S18 acetylase RimI-like enzyme
VETAKAGEGQVHIRRAKPSDARGIAEVHITAWRSAYRGLLPDSVLERLSIEEAEVRWRERLAEPWAELLVLIQDKGIAGYVGYGPTRDEALDPNKVGEVYVLYVAPSAWRRGHGSALLREAMGNLREQGSTEVVLWVLHNNEQAIAFYESAGFVADGARQVKERADGTSMIIARYRQRFEEYG